VNNIIKNQVLEMIQVLNSKILMMMKWVVMVNKKKVLETFKIKMSMIIKKDTVDLKRKIMMMKISSYLKSILEVDRIGNEIIEFSFKY